MKTIIALLAVFSLTACATQRVALKDLRDYDEAIKIAESYNMDTTEMHKHLVDMMVSYLKHPGDDPYLKAMKDAANASQWQAAAAMYQVTKPVPQPMPMSPVEYQRAMGR